MAPYCSVYGCLVKKNPDTKYRFFHFPSDEQRCKRWIKAVGRMDFEDKSIEILHKHYFVCSRHFPDPGRKYLAPNAVPTLCLPKFEDAPSKTQCTQTDFPKLEVTSNSSKCTQTDMSTSPISGTIPSASQNSQSTQTTKILLENSPEMKKLRLELRSEIKKRKVLESYAECNAHLKDSDGKKTLLKKIVDATQKGTKGNRFDEEYLKFALDVYNASPSAYQVLSKIINLPHKRTLRRRKETSTPKASDNEIMETDLVNNTPSQSNCLPSSLENNMSPE